MTEQEWLDCANPGIVLRVACRAASKRKQRLLACALCRTLWPRLDADERRAVELSEDFADGKGTKKALQAAASVPYRAWFKDLRGRWAAHLVYFASRPRTEPGMAGFEADAVLNGLPEVEKALAIPLVRCVLGNPFRPVVLRPGWLTWNGGTAPRLAQAIYDERAFDRLPILADALEEAGCAEPALLEHLRGPGHHARGCWPVDSILGRE
jgi:hypothetical protein